jgi:hypothetical protein
MRPAYGLIGALAAAAAFAGLAHAELLVAPLRQVITAKEPVARYRISNPSARILEARVDWIDLVATPEGYAPAGSAERAKRSAAPYLIVSPARLRLEPGRHAEVVVRLKKGLAIPVGERRSHLLIQTTPARTPLRRASTGLEVDVGLGVSTPVILRGGYAAPALSFEQSRLVRDAQGLLGFETTLRGEGKYSAYGRIEALLEKAGRTTILATAANVAVYPDSGSRKLMLPFALEALPAGRMTVTFFSKGEGNEEALASKTFEIAPPAPPPIEEKKISSPR